MNETVCGLIETVFEALRPFESVAELRADSQYRVLRPEELVADRSGVGREALVARTLREQVSRPDAAQVRAVGVVQIPFPESTEVPGRARRDVPALVGGRQIAAD